MRDYLKIGEIPPSPQDRTFKQWVLMALAGLGIVAALAGLLFTLNGCGGALCKACAKNPQLDGCAQAYQTGICKAEPTTDPTEPPPTTTTTTTMPPEPVEGCTLTANPREAMPDSYVPKHKDAVLAAIRRAHPSCMFGDCLINEETQQGFQAKVEAEVRKGGVDPLTRHVFDPLCAGQHEKTTDEIAVSGKLGDPLEGYDVFTGDDSELVPNPGHRRTIVWAVYKGTWKYPTATQPSPCPAPRWESFKDPNDAQSCTFTWGLKPGRKWVDATLNVRRCCKFCAAIGMGDIGGVMRCQCPLRPEGNPERFACEAEVGAVWQVSGGTLVVNPENIAQANCEGAGCQVRVCTKSGVCSEWAP